MPASSAHKFQAPKGTRDFYPEELAFRRRVESIWRTESINHGFLEVDGPTFEHLELYTAKSGPGIVSELFSFRRAGGDADYALRPEFTPTLARMIAARGAQLPRPIKWFSIPSMFRAERPQRGRLREHVQWNVDIAGDESPRADAEVIAVAVAVLERLGLGPGDVQVRISDRRLVEHLLVQIGVETDRHAEVVALLDRRAKMTPAEFAAAATALGLPDGFLQEIDRWVDLARSGHHSVTLAELFPGEDQPPLALLMDMLDQAGLGDWVRLDLGVVRGLAYYTSTVFEIHEISGRERAVAGGGRYDHLVELFGGPSMPAVGVAMGDVVLSLMLQDRGLLEDGAAYLPRPDVFVISLDAAGDQTMPGLVTSLRRGGLHVRQSYRSTRNLGRLLGDAARARARFAAILGAELEDGRVALKDLETGEQRLVGLPDLAAELEEPP